MLDNVKTAPPRTREDGESWHRRPARWWHDGRTFLTEVRNELKRVTWPTSKEVYATTFVVILTSVFFGVYLFGVDMLLGRAAELIRHGDVANAARFFGVAEKTLEGWYYDYVERQQPDPARTPTGPIRRIGIDELSLKSGTDSSSP